MPHQFIRDLAPGQRLEDQVFLIGSKDLRSTSQGSLYIHVVLCDRTGQLLGRMWQASEEVFETMPEGGFMRFKGYAENYKGKLQFIVEGLRLIDPAEVNVADFVPSTDRDVDEMWAKVKAILGTIESRPLAALMDEFLADQPIVDGFRRAPAAVQMHHAYLGGLLEHTLNLLEIVQLVIPRYPELSLDLMLAGAFLHDIGKTAELSYKTNFTYTEPGQLVGHLAIGVVWIHQKALAASAKLGAKFPDELKWGLQHLVLSHHGQYEFGSPKLPATPEAIALHYLDNLDAKIDMTLKLIANDRDPDSPWTEYSRALGTKLYKRNVMQTPEAGD